MLHSVVNICSTSAHLGVPQQPLLLLPPHRLLRQPVELRLQLPQRLDMLLLQPPLALLRLGLLHLGPRSKLPVAEQSAWKGRQTGD